MPGARCHPRVVLVMSPIPFPSLFLGLALATFVVPSAHDAVSRLWERKRGGWCGEGSDRQRCIRSLLGPLEGSVSLPRCTLTCEVGLMVPEHGMKREYQLHGPCTLWREGRGMGQASF